MSWDFARTIVLLKETGGGRSAIASMTDDETLAIAQGEIRTTIRERTDDAI